MDGKTGLRFYYCGYEKCRSGHSFGPAIRTHYLIHFIISGRGSYRVGTQTFTVTQNQAFLIRPNEVTFYKADEEKPWEYIWLAFDGKEADRIITGLFPYKTDYTIHACKIQKLESLFYLARPDFQSHVLPQTELSGWFYLLFSCFKDQSKSEPKSCEKQYLSEAFNYIHYNYMQDINIDQISMRLGIDRTYLYKIIKKYANCSPKEYLTLHRIAAAKDMLQYSKYSITGIALSCGFHDSSTFCKIFRKYEKQTPSQYRKTVLPEKPPAP